MASIVIDAAGAKKIIETCDRILAENAETVAAPPPQIGSKLIDKANDIAAFASEDESRFVLNGIHFAGAYTEASDGRILIRVPYSPVEQADLPGLSESKGELCECIIPATAVSEAIANMKKGKLDAAHVCDDGDLVAMAANDLGSERLIGVKAIEGQFPNTQQLFPTGDPSFAVTIAPGLLKTIADYAAKNCREGVGVTFEFREATGAIHFAIPIRKGDDVAVGVVMPMKPGLGLDKE